MTGMCYGVNIGGETETATPVEPSSESARRRRMEIHQFRFVASDVAVAPPPATIENGRKRQKLEVLPSSSSSPPRISGKEIQNSEADEIKLNCRVKKRKVEEVATTSLSLVCDNAAEESDVHHRCGYLSSSSGVLPELVAEPPPKFGMTSVCGRRRDMEDAVAIHPSFCKEETHETPTSLHFFGVYDGHGCSHVRNFPSFPA